MRVRYKVIGCDEAECIRVPIVSIGDNGQGFPLFDDVRDFNGDFYGAPDAEGLG